MAENRKIIIEVVARTSGAEKNLNKVGTATEKTGQNAQKASKSFLGLGKTFTAIARGFVIVKSFQLLARAISEVVKVNAEFELTMNKVRAITGASQQEFDRLTKSAKELALGTMFTANEVGELQLAYSKLGFTVIEIEKAAEATLKLATITGDDLGGAADVVGATIRGFGLDASEATKVVDVMAKSFTSSALSLENFKQSMKTVAPIAASANIDLETTTAMLGKLADSGLRGTRAATGLKNIFMALTDETSELAQFLGYTVNNSEGAMMALKDLGEEGLNLAVAQGLISKRAAAAFLVLSDGVKDVESLRGSLKRARGTADEMAGTIEQSLTVKFNKFKSAVEGFTLREGQGLINMLGTALDALSEFINETDRGYRVMQKFKKEQEEVAGGLSTALTPTKELTEAVKKSGKEFDELEVKLQRQKKELEEFAKTEEAYTSTLKEGVPVKSDAFIQRERDIEKTKEDISAKKLLNDEQRQELILRNKMANSYDKNGKATQDLIDEKTKELSRLKELRYITPSVSEKYDDLTERIRILRAELKKLGGIEPTTEVAPAEEEINKANRLADAKIKALMRENIAKAKMEEDDEERQKKVEEAYDANIKLVDKLHITEEEKSAMKAEILLKKFNLEQQFIHKLEKLSDEAKEAEIKRQEEIAKERFALQMQSVQQAMEYASQITEIFQTIQQNRLNRITQENDEQFQLFQEEQERELEAYDAGQKHQLETFVGTQKEKADFERHLALERDEEKKRLQDAEKAFRRKQLAEENRIAKKIFMVDKANTIAQIGVQTALGIAQINANKTVNSDPTLFTLRTLMMALIAGTGAAQITAVGAQQYTPKTFQDGGTIVGASHADGGVPFTVAGKAGFEAEGGEYIFSRSTVDRLGTGLLDAINFGGASPKLFADGGSVARKSMESVAMAQVDMAEQIGDTIALRITEIPVVNVAQETVDTSRLVENAAAMARL